MCAINGFNFKDERLILRMNEATRHRGPDGTGVFVDDFVSFGHNLLAITETPSNSRQPIVSNNKEYVLVYNGEIYNYLDLRKELEAKGERFLTNSDTEVLFKGLIRYGMDFLERLDGMFSLAFYDRGGGKIYLARDFSGMKPLYYFEKSGSLIFSSELRGVLSHPKISRKLDIEAVKIFFLLGYVPGPKTLIENIYKVCPGQYLIYDLKARKLEKGWFDRGYREKKEAIFDPAKFRTMMAGSVLAHTMGLRPFGLYLSGGLDSTVILHELSGERKDLIKTYTTRFDAKDSQINEDADKAKALCKDYNIEHHELLVRENDFIEAIDKTIETIEEPRYNFSLPAYWLLAKQASKDIVVVLLGNGGDELFLGYSTYLESHKIAERYKNYPAFLVNAWYTATALRDGKIAPGSFLRLDRLLDRWIYIHNTKRTSWKETAGGFNFQFGLSDFVRYLSVADCPAVVNQLPDVENAIAELDRFFWLADEDFLRSDKISMHFGMEGRFPFVAKDIISFANNLPAAEKLSSIESKTLVRRAYRSLLPDYIVNKKKTGWYAPVVEWMQSDLGEFVKEVLTDAYYPETAKLFNLEFIRQNYVEKNSKFTMLNVKKFLPVFFFQIWARKFDIKI